MPSPHRWLPLSPRIAAYLLAAALAIALTDSLLRIPVQVSDSLDAIVESATAPSSLELLERTLQRSSATFRPMRYLQARGLITLADWSGLSYSLVLRSVHAVLIAALVLLFVAAVQIRTWLDVGALTVPLTALTGLHTFTGLLREAYPVNHFAQVSVACLAVFVLARGRPSRASGVATVVLLAYSLTLVEAGILVWIVAAASYAAGFSGLRRGTIVTATVVVVLYVASRAWLEIGAPTIGAHGTGFGGSTYSADEIAARFGEAPIWFMVYNVTSAALSVLFSEPRGGTYGLLAAQWTPALAINIASSALLTIAIGWYARRSWAGRRLLHDDARIVLVALAAILANALLCAAYIKDEMLGVAGVFYALAACAALRALLTTVTGNPRPAVALAVAAVLGVTATLWSFRAIGVHYQLRYAAFITRNEWVRVLPPQERDEWPDDPRAVAITQSLKDAAINQRTASSRFLPVWGDRYWGPS